MTTESKLCPLSIGKKSIPLLLDFWLICQDLLVMSRQCHVLHIIFFMSGSIKTLTMKIINQHSLKLRTVNWNDKNQDFLCSIDLNNYQRHTSCCWRLLVALHAGFTRPTRCWATEPNFPRKYRYDIIFTNWVAN